MTRIIFLLLALLPGLAFADFRAGLTAYKHGDYANAARIFKDMAEHGDSAAQFALGLLYDKGQGVPRDDAKALEWYTKSAEGGYAKAQYNLALMYEHGEGIKADLNQAREWFRKAAVGGNGSAMDHLRHLAEGGDVRAQYELGVMALNGDGAKRDPAGQSGAMTPSSQVPE